MMSSILGELAHSTEKVLSLCWSMSSVGPVGGGNATLDLDLTGTLEGWRRDEDGNRGMHKIKTVCIAEKKKKSWGIKEAGLN